MDAALANSQQQAHMQGAELEAFKQREAEMMR